MMLPLAADSYAAVLAAPFAHLGVVADAQGVLRIDFLGRDHALRPPDTELTAVRALESMLSSYWDDPSAELDLPLLVAASAHQQRVWEALRAIPLGQTRSYGEIAVAIGSGARAVGQACGANPLPIVIPCHRAVAKTGRGGFMHQRAGAALDYKLWLLTHESRNATTD